MVIKAKTEMNLMGEDNLLSIGIYDSKESNETLGEILFDRKRSEYYMLCENVKIQEKLRKLFIDFIALKKSELSKVGKTKIYAYDIILRKLAEYGAYLNDIICTTDKENEDFNEYFSNLKLYHSSEISEYDANKLFYGI